jgi:hypothetical protein
MKTHKDFLTLEQIDHLQQVVTDYADNHKLSRKYWIDHEETIREVFNKTDRVLIQQERADVGSTEIGQYIRELILPIVAIPKETNIWLVRSHNPVGIHVDYDETQNQQGRTFIIPLTFDDRIKTIAWNRISTMSEFNRFAQSFATDPTVFEKVNDISNELLLNNCWFGFPSITDYIEVDAVATWESGVVIEFNREQLHASNNYTVFVPHKDYILIHTNE